MGQTAPTHSVQCTAARSLPLSLPPALPLTALSSLILAHADRTPSFPSSADARLGIWDWDGPWSSRQSSPVSPTRPSWPTTAATQPRESESCLHSWREEDGWCHDRDDRWRTTAEVEVAAASDAPPRQPSAAQSLCRQRHRHHRRYLQLQRYQLLQLLQLLLRPSPTCTPLHSTLRLQFARPSRCARLHRPLSSRCMPLQLPHHRGLEHRCRRSRMFLLALPHRLP